MFRRGGNVRMGTVGRGTHRVSVHEAPDGRGHFARKQDHQEEEELWNGRGRRFIPVSSPQKRQKPIFNQKLCAQTQSSGKQLFVTSQRERCLHGVGDNPFSVLAPPWYHPFLSSLTPNMTELQKSICSSKKPKLTTAGGCKQLFFSGRVFFFFEHET